MRPDPYENERAVLAALEQVDHPEARAAVRTLRWAIGKQDLRSSDAKPSDQHTQREPAEDATSGTAGPGPAPD